jgi:hypothetical protein
VLEGDDPVNLRLWLPVYDGSTGIHPLDGNARMHSLWWTNRETGALPTQGDKIVLWADPDDGPQHGPGWTHRTRLMDADGVWHVELTRAVLNPTRAMWDRALTEMTAHGTYNELHPWYTSDGNLLIALQASGWMRVPQ